MKKLTSKERLTRCFYHQETDRPGIYSRTSFPHNDSSYKELKKLLLEKTDLKGFWNGFDLDEYEPITSQEPYREGYIKHHKKINTPLGELTSVYIKNIVGSDGATTEFLIKDEADIEKYLSLPIPDIEVDGSVYFKELKEMGDKGIVVTYLGNCPSGYAAELCGSETFAILSMTHRDLLHELCERKKKIILSLLGKIKKLNAGNLFSMQGEEYLTPPLHGKKDFYDFNVQYDKQIIDFIHDMGGRMHIHCHGSVKSVMDGFIDMGVDVLHPFEAPPLGDITIKEAKELVQDKICIEGNIEISHMYEKTPEEITQITRHIIKEAFYDKKGLILSPTASPYIFGQGDQCYEQYTALIDAVLLY